jgi:hypothetical protein
MKMLSFLFLIFFKNLHIVIAFHFVTRVEPIGAPPFDFEADD